MSLLGKPLERQSLSAVVQERLSRAIMTGELSEGTKLAEPDLAARLGVSRAPVREALIGLECIGLVTSDDRGRTSIAALQAEDIEDIFCVRLALEPLASRKAAARMTPEIIATLSDNIARTRTVKAQFDLSAIDTEFHDIIFQASGMRCLHQVWRGIRYQVELWLNQMQPLVSSRFEETRDITANNHQTLLNALVSGDPEVVAAEAIIHIEGWQSRYLNRAPLVDQTPP
ncbi:MAG TPA: GntR family transcriptional regulator [Schlesneria sp.]|jgi:DNA-binding GntR family transcriptional regulator